MNYKSFNNPPTTEIASGNARPPGNFHLARQGSIYSLTFDELQTTMGTSIGKDFGSMNMDELLKSIWNAEETQTNINNNTAVNNGVVEGGGMIQRQGSLTLPRTISQKTVDEVWKDISKEFNAFWQPNLSQRQETLGEMTLEEFLVKAGVVREENQLVDKPNDNGLFCNLTNSQNKPIFRAVGFQQGVSTNNHNLPLNVNGVRSAQSQQQNQQKSQQLFPKQTSVAYGGGMKGSPVIRNGIMGVSDGVLQGGNMGLVGPRVTAVGSPAVSSDGMGRIMEIRLRFRLRLMSLVGL
ncbi:putative plant bZIP transcription factor [Helianthus annuus]|uniref:ABSCISIC ACID-INSENSITIVE 5-like protein 7 n=1 Tax=Helianthus annuus TaxID=4232 RepID=A0A9K3N3A7_HELAN|nr:hypothetical protein HanXRQr2_Chr10g0431641 [Helianthus annuus]KAJ0513211.1 putative plant bZIP transcription factor [Helianthus annuus]KAJ0520983.1 putative plant bZIP transcription factor [Helianthus annuus]KAJ0529335.1 putative plant bZIP transcription factor [Helianthus annuus]KAJ0696220.1 putative plant bZIP transcription factor [Helianthus annuus]